MSQNISLSELLNVSIREPRGGTVNFSALHTLLLAMLKHLDLREVSIPWMNPPPPGDPPLGVSAPAPGRQRDPEERQRRAEKLIARSEEEAPPGTELQERTASPPSPPPAGSGSSQAAQWSLQTRIQKCEDSVSQVMKTIEKLHDEKNNLKDEMKALRHEQQLRKVVGVQSEAAAAVDRCCHRLDALEEAVRSLRASIQKSPEDLSQFVTWDAIQLGLLTDRQNLDQELVLPGVTDGSIVVQPAEDPDRTTITAPPQSSSSSSITRPTEPTAEPATIPEQTLTQQADPQSRDSGGSAAAGSSVSAAAGSSAADPAAGSADGSSAASQLEVRVSALEKGKVDQSQLTRLRESLTNTGSREASHLMQQVNQQRALIDSLLSDREKLEELEDMILNLKRPDTEPSSEPDSVDSDRRCQELSQQVSFLRRSVQKLEADLKQLKVKQVQTEQKPADQHLQDQLDDLRSLLEEVMLNQDPQMKDHEDQSESSTSRKPRLQFKVNDQLQDSENETIQQQSEDRTQRLQERQNVQLLNDVQNSVLQLQADYEKLQEITGGLCEDSQQMQNHIEKLFRTTEQLEVKKADKQMVETEIKADKCVLDTKVSRLQLDLVREQLTSMFHELLNKVTDQEQDWSKVMERLSTEMECKLNRIELDSVKKQLEDLWKNIQEKLQAQEAPEHEDAAGIRKQLVDRFHCLSCDRPIVKHIPGPHLETLPSSPAFPSHKSMRPFTVYAVEQLRQQHRSLKPGTNRFNFKLRNSVRRRQVENLEKQNQNPAGDQQ
ncbi:glutamine-rich protein 2 isoform X3 [Amphiprion ocellaris]|uniref:glutamine-rich protein 2 isoform X3 n=1 Tax=Amphiprion ocellaris TaxID=80972 RepID=UPI0024116961|nr:glutamine-rich protein 2 isoform X3 [Amphiprion ocellaris]